MGTTEEEAAETGMPETVIVTIEMTFGGHGETFEIVVPEAAFTAPTEDATEEEATEEDAVEETEEEAPAEEETEETVEETEETDAE